jgi:uncharacterized membrane protein YeaQ/YmgE (transglycosylase-associated protein family)
MVRLVFKNDEITTCLNQFKKINSKKKVINNFPSFRLILNRIHFNLLNYNLLTNKIFKIMGLLYALLIGAAAGWLAGKLMKGGGFGALINIILGIVGGIVGNWLFGLLGVSLGDGVVGDLLTGVIGAVVVLFIAGLLKKK